jgi:hypothetical protein
MVYLILVHFSLYFYGFRELWTLAAFSDIQLVGLIGRGISQSQGQSLHT